MIFEHVCTVSVEDFKANGPAKAMPGVGPVLCELCGYRKPKATKAPRAPRAEILGGAIASIARIECRLGTYRCVLDVQRQCKRRPPRPTVNFALPPAQREAILKAWQDSPDETFWKASEASDVRRIVTAWKGTAFKGATYTAHYVTGAPLAMSLNQVCALVDVTPSTRSDANAKPETKEAPTMKKAPINKARPDTIATVTPDELRAELATKHGAIWSPGEMAKEFETVSFSAPFVAVKRRADGVLGVLEFSHSPRFYWGWTPKADDTSAKAKAPKAAKIAPKATDKAQAPAPLDSAPSDDAKAQEKAARVDAGHTAIADALKSGPRSRVMTFGYDAGLLPEHLKALMDAAGVVLAVDTRANDARGPWSRKNLRETLGSAKYKAAMSLAEVAAAIEGIVANGRGSVILLRKEEAPGDNDFHLEIARSIRCTHLFRNEIIEGADLQAAIDLDAREGGDHEYDCEVAEVPSVAITAAPTQGIAALAAS